MSRSYYYEIEKVIEGNTEKNWTHYESFKLSMRCLVYGLATKLASLKQRKKNQCSALREQAWQYSEQEEEATKCRAEKKTLVDSNYFYKGINTVHKFLCAHNAACVHVMYTIVTVHAIHDGLSWYIKFPKKLKTINSFR